MKLLDIWCGDIKAYANRLSEIINTGKYKYDIYVTSGKFHDRYIIHTIHLRYKYSRYDYLVLLNFGIKIEINRNKIYLVNPYSEYPEEQLSNELHIETDIKEQLELLMGFYHHVSNHFNNYWGDYDRIFHYAYELFNKDKEKDKQITELMEENLRLKKELEFTPGQPGFIAAFEDFQV